MTSAPAPTFAPALSGALQDEARQLRPRWNADGLAAAIAQDSRTGEVLMMAWMNAEALERTLQTGRATYWSRSRQLLWVKGETSGNIQLVDELRVDCDQDAILLRVTPRGPACHTGRVSCFYRTVEAPGHALTIETKPD